MTPLDTNEKWVASLAGHGALVAALWLVTLSAFRDDPVPWVLTLGATAAYVGLFVCWRLWLRVIREGKE